MITRDVRASARTPSCVAAVLLLVLLAICGARTAAANNSDRGGDDAAVKEVIAGFSNGWNGHDAQEMCASLADDVQWVSWRGEVYSSRKEVEDVHAKLFADLYKNTHRTDVVKSIRYVGPDLASVDDYWTMTGARKRDGAGWPYRAGYANFLMAKRGGRWIVVVSHTADFNAQAPTTEYRKLLGRAGTARPGATQIGDVPIARLAPSHAPTNHSRARTLAAASANR